MLSGNTYFRCISMIFDHLPYFSVSKSIFDDKMISQWEHPILSIKGCDAIRPKLNCFISMVISVAKLSGFPPLVFENSKSSRLMNLMIFGDSLCHERYFGGIVAS